MTDRSSDSAGPIREPGRRSDRSYGPVWHVPGGIIRFGETAAEPIRIVARRPRRDEARCGG